MKRRRIAQLIFALAILAVGVSLLTSRTSQPPEIARSDAVELASRGGVERIIFDLGDEKITLLLRDGRSYRVLWIEDPGVRNRFMNELAFPGVTLQTGSGGGAAFTIAEAFFWLFRLSYVLIPLALIDLIVLVRRRARRWQSVDVLWLLAILILPPFGPLAWFIAGHRVRGRELPPPRGPRLPTDDIARHAP